MKTELDYINENKNINKQISDLEKQLNKFKYHVEAGDRVSYSLGRYYTLNEAQRVAKTDLDSWITPLTPDAIEEMKLAGYRF